MTINLIIADDHPIVIDGLQRVLVYHQDICLIGHYATGEALMAGLEGHAPDVLLLDIQMPDITGDELLPVILKKYPGIKVLVLTNFDSALYANNMFRRGAKGYILKTAETETLIAAIKTVYEGGTFIETEMQEKIGKMNQQHRASGFSKTALTLREKEVLQLIVDGYTAAEIGAKLFLSPGTVKNYRNNIMLKLDAENTAVLVKKALKLGLAQ
ncbi:response regulator [Taibaiella koreensis]|uniref:response regulator n=1 Tax=Taibaiella koreensis TaxID=1268548 RepID=UPI000E59C9FB|nr:response regulator transcription factor [Taibaiella koreensis]